jgi:thiol-disulfide isomerase/thioredoxin
MVKYLIPVSLLFLFLGCGNNDNTKSAQEIKTAKQHVQTDFSFTTLDGNTITLKKKNGGFVLKGDEKKLLFIDLFATWCRPCQLEVEALSNLKKKYADKLNIISVPIENISKENLELFAQNYHASYTIANSDNNQPFIDALAKNLNLNSNLPIPLMVLYKDGVEINHYIGATEEEFIESDIKQALGK